MILITGASGLLGINFLISAIQRFGHVAGVVNRHSVTIPDSQIFQVDLVDSEALLDLIQHVQPQLVVHCAAATDVDWCEQNPEAARSINVDTTAVLAGAVHEHGGKLIFISTDSVFSGREAWYRESDPANPINTYAKSKLEGEQIVLDTHSENLVIRTNFFGWSIFNRNSLAEWILDQLSRGQSINGFADVFFTPLLVNDLSEIILDMIERDIQGLYHVAAADSCSKYEFANQLAKVFEHPDTSISPVSIDSVALPSPRPRNTTLDTSLAQESLGRKMPSILDGITRFRLLREQGYVHRLESLRGQ